MTKTSPFAFQMKSQETTHARCESALRSSAGPRGRRSGGATNPRSRATWSQAARHRRDVRVGGSEPRFPVRFPGYGLIPYKSSIKFTVRIHSSIMLNATSRSSAFAGSTHSSPGAVPGAGESQRALKLCVDEPVDAIPVRAAAQSASHNARPRAHLRQRRHA